MSDSTLAIELRGVSKRYVLYPSRMALLLGVLGVGHFLPNGRRYPQHEALSGIDLQIRHGARVGIIGRNGAGKTSLLKLITRNLKPSSGEVKVNGNVQALMTSGLGFHPELTGAQNIRASLIYNALDPGDMEEAIADVVEFVELEEYLDQPLKTYSLGMQSRLAFATATAIKPDILIVDEVLGAGDAYFAAKSAERMERLTSNGATLLLVSHSMAQVVQFCDSAIWLDKGRFVMEGETLEVVKAYERFIRDLDEDRLVHANRKRLAEISQGRHQPDMPRGSEATDAHEGEDKHSLLERGISRWRGSGKLILRSFRILDRHGAEKAVLDSGEVMTYEIEISNEIGVATGCWVAVNTYLLDGKQVMLNWSECVEIPSNGAIVRVCYDPLILGNGDYVVSVGLYENLDMSDLSTARYFDLWDRSFQFKARTPFPLDTAVCKPPCQWVVS